MHLKRESNSYRSLSTDLLLLQIYDSQGSACYSLMIEVCVTLLYTRTYTASLQSVLL